MSKSASVESLLAHRAWVRTLSRAIVADPGAADDVEQATWLTALRRPPADDGSVKAWLAQVVKSRALDIAREGRRRAAREEACARRRVEPSAADVSARFDAERRVAQAVHALPEPLRTTVLLRFHEDLSVRGTARRMGVPYETARARLRVALARLRADLGGTDGRGLACVALLAGGWKGALMSSTKKTAAIAAACLAIGFFAGAWWSRPAATTTADSADVAKMDAPSRSLAPQPPRFAVHDRRRDDASFETERASGAVAAKAPAASSARTSKPADGGSTSESDAAKAAAESKARTQATAPGSPPPEQLNGRVVDYDTGEPMAGVRVLYAAEKVGGGPNWHGDRTLDDGRFSNKRPNGWDQDGVRVELRLTKEGYENVLLPITDAAPIVRMRRATRAVLPGRILGAAHDASGKPLVGVLVVEGYDELGVNVGQFVAADARGEFVMDGVSPGHYRLTMRPGKPADVVVAEGGDAKLSIEVPADPRTDDERVHGSDPTHVGSSDWWPGWGKWAPVLDASGRRAPPREVVVTGVPDERGVFVRVALREAWFWRAPQQSGEARFPSVPPGRWKVLVQRPGQPLLSMWLDVPAGDGPLRVDFKP